MKKPSAAVIGLGAIGTVLAASLLGNDPETMLVVRKERQRDDIRKNGITITGELNCRVQVKNLLDGVLGLKQQTPDLIFICTKTFDLLPVLDCLKDAVGENTRIVSTQNGLGPEDVIAGSFGAGRVLRMSLNFGASLTGTSSAHVNFFNPPNYLGGLVSQNRDIAITTAQLFSNGGLYTEFVDDIRLHVWKKMIMKATMASLCAVTGKTIRQALEFAATKEIAEACFGEALAVARAMGLDLGENYLTRAMGYLEKVGVHKDSMCVDIANKTQTEIDFLGGKIVEYGRQTGVPTPHFVTMTNLVRAMEHDYLHTS